LRRTIRHLDARRGEPDNRVLSAYKKDGLCYAVVTLDGPTDWAITYYVVGDEKAILLTVIQLVDGDTILPQSVVTGLFEKAVRLMELCKERHNDVRDIPRLRELP
jgi:hypothetical protein